MHRKSKAFFDPARAEAPARLLLIAAILTIATMAFGAASASAALDHAFKGAVGAGELSSPTQLAIDQSNGDLYVADLGTETVDRFDASGAPATFSATGTNSLPHIFATAVCNQLAVDNSAAGNPGDFYTANFEVAGVQAFKPSGEAASFSASGTYISANTLTGTPTEAYAAAAGVATDSAGDIYVADIGGFVDVYAPSGEYLTQFAAPGACGIAVDSLGDVYVGTFNAGGVNEFTPSAFPPSATTTYGAAHEVTSAAAFGLAVDPANDELYVDQNGSFTQFASAADGNAQIGGEFGTAALGGSSKGIAIARAGGATEGDVYVSTAGQVDRFGPLLALPDVSTGAGTTSGTEAVLHGTVNPNGEALVECFFEYGLEESYGVKAPCEAPDAVAVGAGNEPVPVHAALPGLNPAATYHYRLVAKNANGSEHGLDQTFSTTGPPSIASESALYLGRSAATLTAQVDPHGLTTTYRFEYGTSAAYGSNTPEAVLGSGQGARTAAAALSGLQPATGYHFRVVVQNSAGGPVFGPDQTFATTNALACPNEAFRVGPSASLPDCRAYELVSPAAKDGGVGGVLNFDYPHQAAASAHQEGSAPMQALAGGSALTYTGEPFFNVGEKTGQEQSFEQYTSSRSPTGWATANGDTLAPETAPTPVLPAAATATGAQVLEETLDGAKVFFLDAAHEPGLTPDSNAAAGEPDLYEYDVPTTTLTDLTPHVGEHADVRGILGTGGEGAAAGSYVYFVAGGLLAEGASPGGCCNLYLRHNGITTFIAPLAPEDETGFGSQIIAVGSVVGVEATVDWPPLPYQRTAAVSPDGRYLAFPSWAQLTSATNENTQIYRYSVLAAEAGEEALACISCDPNGGAASRTLLPSSPRTLINGANRQRSVLDDGRVFFTTATALVSQDINQQADVYEWQDGAPHLISGGTSELGRSVFTDASTDGRDVFFTTSQSLLPQDGDEIVDVYDAREGGGFPQAPPPACAASSACPTGATSQPPPASSSPTSSFDGPEEGPNHVQKRHHHKKKHHHKKHHGKRAGHKQGGGSK